MPNKDIFDKLNSGREYRNIAVQDLELRSDADSGEMIVEGYCTTFNEPYTLYDDGEYRVDEQVDAHAFDKCDMSDVILQYNHEGRVYARTRNNTLELETDDHGLKIRAYLGGTEAGRQLYEEIKGGYTDRMSFGFIVDEDTREITEDRASNKTLVLRTITRIKKMFDASAVSMPANDATAISARSLSDGLVREAQEELQVKRAAEYKRKKLMLLLEVDSNAN